MGGKYDSTNMFGLFFYIPPGTQNMFNFFESPQKINNKKTFLAREKIEKKTCLPKRIKKTRTISNSVPPH